MKNSKKYFKPGSNGYHEVFHLVSVAVAIWEEHIHNHPVMAQDKKAEKQSDKIGMLMAELYQYLGAIHFEDKKDKRRNKKT